MKKDEGDNVSLSGNIPTGGYYVAFIPQVSGTLNVTFYINADLSSGTKYVQFYDSDGTQMADNAQPKKTDQVYSNIKLTKGKTYYVYINGSGGLCFKTYTFTPESSTPSDLFEGKYTYTNVTMDEERPNTGTYTFTKAGAIEGGTVISDVPGITCTIGAAGDAWSVVDATALDGSYNLGTAAAYCASGANRPTNTSGCFFKFVPSVNGVLKLHVYNTNEIHCDINNKAGDKLGSTRVQTLTVNLIAGKTYDIAGKGGGFYLESFSFTPTFMDATTMNNTYPTEITSPFDAYLSMAKDAYPKLIAEASQGEAVRWSESTRSVMLYSNNDVEIQKAGKNLVVRGRVFSPNGDQLNAFYLLNANVLAVTATTVEDQAYVDAVNNYAYTFTFDEDIAEKTANSISVESDANTAPSITTAISGKTLTVTFASLEEGATYKIKIAADGLQKSDNANYVNADIVYSFSVENDQEPKISMVYPTKMAKVSDPIILETDLENNKGQQIGISENYPVKGILTAEGQEDMVLVGAVSSNKLIFRPTTALANNTTYTLTLPLEEKNVGQETGNYSVIMTDNSCRLAHEKTFTITTGSATGTMPVVASHTPENNATNLSVKDGGSVTITFDQEVEFVPYSNIYIIPLNGSESTTQWKSTMTADDIVISGKTMTLTTTSDEWLQYDLWHEVIVPANSVTGTGGKPNDAYTFKIKAQTNPEATQTVTYPNTWDFNRLGALNDSDDALTSSVDFGKNDETKSDAYKEYNVLYKEGDDFRNRKVAGNNWKGWDQGNNVYITTAKGTKTYLPEFNGLRISLTKRDNNRFTIHPNGTNSDGTSKYQFALGGNTHYLTIPEVPAGKLYIKCSASYIGINTPGVYFTEGTKYGSGTAVSLSDKIQVLDKVQGTQLKSSVAVIEVPQKGDVSLCLKNFSCDVIAVSSFEKTFSPNYTKDGKTYTSDCQAYDTRFDLSKTLAENTITAYYVSGVSKGSVTLTAADKTKAVPKNMGTILTAAKEGTVPFFQTDINTTTQENPSGNELIGTVDGVTPAKDDNSYVYVLSYAGTKANKGIGFYYWTGSIPANKAYLKVDKTLIDGDKSAAQARVFSLFFEDAPGETTGIKDVDLSRQQDGYFYNMNGVRVERPTKGIYIRNGKKVIVK